MCVSDANVLLENHRKPAKHPDLFLNIQQHWDTKQPERIEDRMSRKYTHEPFPVLTPKQLQQYGYDQNLADIDHLFYFKPSLRQSYATYKYYLDTTYKPAFDDLHRAHENSGTIMVDDVGLSLI